MLQSPRKGTCLNSPPMEVGRFRKLAEKKLEKSPSLRIRALNCGFQILNYYKFYWERLACQAPSARMPLFVQPVGHFLTRQGLDGFLPRTVLTSWNAGKSTPLSFTMLDTAALGSLDLSGRGRPGAENEGDDNTLF